MKSKFIFGMALMWALFVHSAHAAEPSEKACAYLIDQSFFYHVYEKVCGKNPVVGIAMADRFTRQKCESIIKPEQIILIRNDVLARVKTEIVNNSEQKDGFCSAHSYEYENVLTIQ